ncbi:unnamed protein product [Paramecium pentaurelia]|uniref:Glutaredoxin domain-containing protein n=1 Tax=Paramecium pentaurelia TaxID=43138 RepID=A0A8S1WGC8_9CILI|nr:unnamed protein product [Paramecium pentaurelia]
MIQIMGQGDNSTLKLRDEIKNISAFYIYQFWKKYKIRKTLKNTIKAFQKTMNEFKLTQTPLVVYYSSLAPNIQTRQDQLNLFNMLKLKKIEYKEFDLVDNKMVQGWVKQLLNKYKLPFITINNIFIGGYEDFYSLFEQGGFLQRIINKDYEMQCINCNEQRRGGDRCLKCKWPYEFFKKE